MDDRKLLSPMYSGLRKRIPKPEFMSILTPIPPIDEMRATVRTVSAAAAGSDVAIDQLTREIGLLSEYRTRLVSDVVSGKLDVREAAARLPNEPSDDIADDTPLGDAESDSDANALDDEESAA